MELIITIGAYCFVILMGLYGILMLLALVGLFLESLARNPFGAKILKGIMLRVVAVLVTTIVLTSMLYIPSVLTTKIAFWLFLYTKPLIGSLFFIAMANCWLLFKLANITQPIMEQQVYDYLKNEDSYSEQYNEEEAENRSWDVHTWAMILSVFIMYGTIIIMCTSVIVLDTALPSII